MADIHMMPEETVQAALDLQAKVFLPVHWGSLPLPTTHGESYTEAVKHAKPRRKNSDSQDRANRSYLGESVPFEEWWKGLIEFWFLRLIPLRRGEERSQESATRYNFVLIDRRM